MPQFNPRDITWLSFNERVLQEAMDKTVPLHLRIRFLGIFSNNLDEFLLAKQLCIQIEDQNILKQALTEYFKSEDKEVHKVFILTDEVFDFLKTDEGKKILVQFREEIFKNYPDIVQFIKMKYPSQDEENLCFYPVIVKESEDLFFINCAQSQVRDPENLKDILNKLSNLRSGIGIKVSYLDQKGVDSGALTRDFITNLFENAANSWNLHKEISQIFDPKLALLGPLLKYVFDSERKLSVGEVFHETFFKGMIQFDYSQIISNHLSDLEIEKLVKSGYNTAEENANINDIFTFLEWDGSSKFGTNYKCIEILMKLSSKLTLDQELTQLLPKEIFRKEVNPETEEIKYVFIEDKDKMDEIQAWIEKKSNRLEELKEIVREDVLEGYNDQIRNLHILLKSMNFSEKAWKIIKAEGVEAFKLKIQGEFSKERLLEKIVFRDNIPVIDTNLFPSGTPEHDEALKGGTTEFDKTLKGHLENWFKNTDEDSLRKFLKRVTGSPAIPLENINIFEKPEYYDEYVNGVKIQKRSQFQAHACFNHIDVPVNLTQEQIFFYMNTLVADEEGSFDLA